MRIRLYTLVAAAALAFAPTAFANHTIKVSKSVTVNAPADKVWAEVKDFGALQNWHPAVESTKIDKGGDNKPGTVRTLSLKGGGNITETLTAYSDKGRSQSYKINEGVLPVAGYTSTISVKPAGKDKATLSWTSSFKAKAGTSDADAKKTIEGVYDAGLGNVQKKLGG